MECGGVAGDEGVTVVEGGSESSVVKWLMANVEWTRAFLVYLKPTTI